MSISLSDTLTEDRARALSRALDAGSTGGKLKIYSGTQPSAGGSPSGTLLATLIFPDPSADTYSAGVLTLHEPIADLGVADGVATWARLTDSADNWVADCSAGATGSGHPVIINSATAEIYAGGTVSVNAITVSEV